MPDNVEIIIALLIPFAVLSVLRINAAVVFLSLCLGYVLVQFSANDADSLISFLAPDTDSVSASTLRLAMLFAPVVLTGIFMLFSVRGRVRALLNMLPAAGVSVLALLMAVPLLTPGMRAAIQSHAFWQQISQAQAAIVGVSALISLIFLWAQRRGKEDKKRK